MQPHSRFYKSIDAAHTFANDTLVHVLLHDQKLLPRLRSLRHYFFLSHSAFLTTFLDAAHIELRKYAKSANRSKLQSILDVSLSAESCPRFSEKGDNPREEEETYREDVKVTLASTTLYEYLMKIVSVDGVIGYETGGMGGGVGQDDEKKSVKDIDKEKEKASKLIAQDVLMLDYTVKFPLSLVISRKTIVQYQFIFRLLWHLRVVEQALLSMWCDQKGGAWRSSSASSIPTSASTPNLGTQTIPSRPGSGRTTPKETSRPASRQHQDAKDYPELVQWRRAVFVLRSRMLAFVQQLLAFVTYQVLEPNWQRLEKALGLGGGRGKVATVDALLRAHEDFLDTCLKECMLTSSRLIKVCFAYIFTLASDLICCPQAFEKIMTTCSTFAAYSSRFNKTLTTALASLDDPSEESESAEMAKRWDFLRKFEANFEHWFNVSLYYVSSLLQIPETMAAESS